VNAVPEDPPVSVKAALRCGDHWVLLRNDRNEWELPGGRIDAADQSLQTVVERECREELGIDVEVGQLVAAYLFEVVPGKRVTIVCYAATADTNQFTISNEHDAVGLFTTSELAGLELPIGYRDAIAAAERLAT